MAVTTSTVDALNGVGSILDAVAGLKPDQITGLEAALVAVLGLVMAQPVSSSEHAQLVAIVGTAYLVCKTLSTVVDRLRPAAPTK